MTYEEVMKAYKIADLSTMTLQSDTPEGWNAWHKAVADRDKFWKLLQDAKGN